MKETKDMTVEEIKKELPPYQGKKGSSFGLSYSSPILSLNSNGEMKPNFACSVDSLDEKTAHESFLNTLVKNGYDRANKTFSK